MPTKIFSPRDRKSLSSCSRSASRIFCRITCLAACAPMRPIEHRLDRLLDVVVDLDVGDLLRAPRSAGSRNRAAAGRPRSGTTCQRRKVSYSPVSRSTETRMSTSPPCSFFDAEASAASTAPNTTSRSTLFSREMASTSINSSRFIGSDLRPPLRRPRGTSPAGAHRRRREPAPLEIDHRHEPGLAHFVQREIERLLAPCRRSTARARQPPAVASRGCSTPLVVLAALERQLQRQLDLLAGKAREVGGLLQRPVEPRRRHLEPLVGDSLRPRARAAAGA